MTIKDSQLIRIKKLLQLFQEGKIPVLAKHEVHPDLNISSRENYLYFTLPPSINFQRNSPAMWASALKTWKDPKTQWIFFPEKVATESRSKAQKALTQYKLALQTNKHTDIWIAICKTLHNSFKNDPRELLKAGHNDVREILELVQVQMKKDFPYLSGPKLANYWLFILSLFTDVKLGGMEGISIIPDTHVIQASHKLGITNKETAAQKVAEAWLSLLDGSGIIPVQMHPVLWNWSRNSFLPEL